MKKTIISLLIIVIILIGTFGYLGRYHFLPVNYLIEKIEDACIIKNNNNLVDAKKCICSVRSMLTLIPENEVRSLVIKLITEDKIGIQRSLVNNVGLMKTAMVSELEEECKYSRIRFHNGVVKDFFPNGNLKQEHTWKDSKLVHIITYYENGNIEIESGTSDYDESGTSIKHGKMKHYYKSGNIESEGNYKNGKQNGVYRSFFKNKNIKEEGYFKDDKLNGMAKTYYENGNIEMELNYKNGELNGHQKAYFDNKRLKKEANQKEGKLEGLEKSYYLNGEIETEGNYKDGILNGIAKYYYDDGSLSSEQNYKNGKLDGIAKWFYPDGSFCETLWHNSDFQSRKCFNKDGQIMDLNGIIKFYHKNEKLASECNYRNGKQEGVCTSYYTDGTLYKDRVFKNEKLNGEVNVYDTMGKLIETSNFKDGIPVSK